MKKSEHWQFISNYFGSFGSGYVDTDKHPMVKLVLAMRNNIFYKELYPSVSVIALGLSRYEIFKDRLLHPMVYIYYSGKNHFSVEWQLGQGKTVRETMSANLFDNHFLDELENWLNINF